MASTDAGQTTAIDLPDIEARAKELAEDGDVSLASAYIRALQNAIGEVEDQTGVIAYTTIPVPVRVKEQLKTDKGDLTWGEYVEMLHTGSSAGVLDYDDVVAACEQAMRNVLPDDVVQ